MGRGTIHRECAKRKLNTKITTESEFVEASNYIPWKILAKRFLQHQGCGLKIKVFYQNSKSAMKIEKNGRRLCGEKSRHIHMTYFFIKNVLIKEGIELTH